MPTHDSHDGKPQGPEQAAAADGQAKPKKSALRRALNIMAFLALLGIVAAAAYGLSALYARYLGSEVLKTNPLLSPEPLVSRPQAQPEPQSAPARPETMMLTLYFPVEGRLYKEQRGVPRPPSVRDIAAVAVSEFMAGPSARESILIPRGGRLLGVYYGTDGILYLDFSDPFRHGFQGGAREEYLLLRALRESVMANVYKVKGIKLLVEGAEVDTFGGHLSLRGMLSEALRYPYEAGEVGDAAAR